MDDQTTDNSYEPLQNDSSAYSEPRRYHRPHISQDPINDAEPEYVTRNRYQTLEESQSGRRHMGVASSDPVYLKDAPLSKNSTCSQEQTQTPVKQQQRGPRPKQTLTHSARYLETPKAGEIDIYIVKQTAQTAPSPNRALDHCHRGNRTGHSFCFLQIEKAIKP